MNHLFSILRKDIRNILMRNILKWFLGVIILGIIIGFLGSHVSQLVWGREKDIFQKIIGFTREQPSVIALLVVFLLGFVLVIFRDEYHSRRKKILETLSPYLYLVPCHRLKPEDFNLTTDYHEFYIPRRAMMHDSVYTVGIEDKGRACGLEEELEKIFNSEKESSGVLLVARPKMGKSRTIFQMLKRDVFKNKTALIVRSEPSPEFLSSLQIPHQKDLIIVLDDLHKFTRRFDAHLFLEKIRSASGEFSLLASTRDGGEFDHVKKEMPDYFLRNFQGIEIAELDNDQGRELAKRIGKDFKTSPFDGSPGSITMDIEAMIQRYHNLDLEEKCLMNTLALLYTIRCFKPSRKDVELISFRIFGLKLAPYKFDEKKKHLLSEGLINGSSLFEEENLYSRDVYMDRISISKDSVNPGTIQRVFSVAREAKNTHILWGLGGYYYFQKEYEESRKCCDSLLEIDDKDETAWYNKGVVLGKMGKPGEEISCYERALAINPEYASALYNKGVVLGEMGKPEEALSFYEKALSINPEYADVLNNKGVVLGKTGKPEEALSCYEKALAINPEYAEAWYNKGVVLGKMGKPEGALSCYEKALAINPDDAEAWYNKGVALGKMGKPEEALSCYEKALAINPEYAEAWYNKGVVLLKMGKPEEALSCFEKALAINPELADAWYNKGDLLKDLGNIQEAKNCFIKVLELDPEGKTGKLAQQILDSLKDQ